jgi:hypothetical protein
MINMSGFEIVCFALFVVLVSLLTCFTFNFIKMNSVRYREEAAANVRQYHNRSLQVPRNYEE